MDTCYNYIYAANSLELAQEAAFRASSALEHTRAQVLEQIRLGNVKVGSFVATSKCTYQVLASGKLEPVQNMGGMV